MPRIRSSRPAPTSARCCSRPPRGGSSTARASATWSGRRSPWRWWSTSSRVRAGSCVRTARPTPDRSVLHLLLQVVLDPHALDQVKLGLDPVHVLFFVLEDVDEQLAADEILHLLAVRDRLAQQRDALHLQRQVALEDLARAFADLQLAERLEVRQPLQE